jgi:hypothetical protein
MNPIDLNEEISVPEELEPTPAPKAQRRTLKLLQPLLKRLK